MMPLQEARQKMREQIQAIRSTRDPEERRRLLAEHMRAMQDMMQMMQGMREAETTIAAAPGMGGGGMMGMMHGGRGIGMPGPAGGMKSKGMMARGRMMGECPMMSGAGAANQPGPNCPRAHGEPGMMHGGRGMGMMGNMMQRHMAMEQRVAALEKRLDAMQTVVDELLQHEEAQAEQP